MEQMRILLMAVCIPMALSWPAVIAYMFYLGFSGGPGSWITDEFFHWEGISFLLMIPCALGISGLMYLVDRRAALPDRNKK